MKRFIVAVIVSIFAFWIPVGHAEDQADAVKKMLERLAGSWSWTGKQANIGAENSPYGQAGRFVGSGEGRLIMDGQFILDEYQEKSPEGNMLHGVSLVGYDPIKKCFVARDCMSDGSTSIAEFTIEGRTRKDNITITSKTGEILLARVAGEYSRDWKRLEATWEGSTDNGKTWQHWCTFVTEKTGETPSKEQEAIQAAMSWGAARERRDIAFIDSLLADEWTGVSPNGNPITKSDMLAIYKSPDFKSTSNVYDLDAKVYGNTAVVKGLLTQKATYKGENWCGTIRLTETYVKRNGRWQCVASHATGVKQGGPDVVEPRPEMKKLEVLVGDWVYEGERVDPPFEGLPPAGKYSAKETKRFVLGGSFLESRLELKGGPGKLSWIIITGYDAEAKNYSETSFMSMGDKSRYVMTVSPDGRTFTSTGPMRTQTGQELLAKHVTKLSPDGNSSAYRLELSDDNGTTWKYWLGDKGRKVKK